MARRCACGRPAHGSMGMLVSCRYCMAEKSGLDQAAFRKPIEIVLRDGDRETGRTVWIPWSFQAGKETRGL